MAYDGYEIGPHIRQIRKGKKMTIAELSDKTELSSSSINQIEQGGGRDVDSYNHREDYESMKEGRAPVHMEHVYPHAIRRTFCARCFKADMNPKVVQKLMGHANYSTTVLLHNSNTPQQVYQIDNFIQRKTAVPE